MSSPVDPLVEAIAQRVAAILAPKIEAANALKPRLLSVEQAAVYLGRSKAAVRHLAATKAFRTVRADLRMMFDVKDLDSWIDGNKQ